MDKFSKKAVVSLLLTSAAMFGASSAISFAGGEGWRATPQKPRDPNCGIFTTNGVPRFPRPKQIMF